MFLKDELKLKSEIQRDIIAERASMQQKLPRNNIDEINFDKNVHKDFHLEKPESDFRKIERILNDLKEHNTVFDKAHRYIKK